MEPSRSGAQASRGRYFVDDVVVDAGRRTLVRNGESLAVTRLTFDLLLALVDAAPNLVTHDEIIERVWGPRRVVSPETLAQCVTRLRHALGDDAAHPRYVESIRGQGYRLVPAVLVAPDEIARGADDLRGAALAVPRRRSVAGITTVIVLAVVAAIGFGRMTRDPEAIAGGMPGARQLLSTPAHSLAVLPIPTSGLAAADALIADGLYTDILNELARIGDLSVIARATMRQIPYVGLSPTAIAAELNVDSVMQLDLELADQSLKLTAELIDGPSGTQRWFDRYDVPLSDVFALQRALAAGVVEALGASVTSAESARLRAQPTTSAEAYEFFLTASRMFEVDSTDRSKVARSYLDKAIELDPQFALAYGLKALIHASGIDDFTDSAEGIGPVNAERAQLAEEYAAAAIAIDPGTIVAHRARAVVGMRSWRWNDAERAFESALENGPNDVFTLSEFGFFRVCALGDSSGMRFSERALELDPRSARAHELYGRTLGCTGDHRSALAALRRSVELDPTSFRRRAMSAYTAAHVLPANEVAEELRALEPMMTDTRLSGFPAVALTFAEIGYEEEARRIVAQFEAMNGHGTTNTGSSIYVYLAVGDEDAAYRTLEQAVENLGPGSGYLTMLVIRDNRRRNPILDTPRFVELRKRIRSRD